MDKDAILNLLAQATGTSSTNVFNVKVSTIGKNSRNNLITTLQRKLKNIDVAGIFTQNSNSNCEMLAISLANAKPITKKKKR